MASSSSDPDSLVTFHFHDFRVERMRHWWTLLGEDDHADCHNSIFTHGIFSGVGTQNGTARTKPGMIRRGLATSNTPKKKVRDTFPKPIWEATFAQRFSPTRCNLVREPRSLRQEVHFSYHTQLSDRQELLRSSRNLSQKMTPWHKEHSDGLRSQDHILRTQARLCARPVPLENSSGNFSHRRCHACAQSLPDSQQVDLQAQVRWKEDTFMHDKELSDRQEFTGASRNPDRKTALKRTKNTPGGLCSRGHISQVQARISANLEPCKSRQRKLSNGTKNVEIRHRELGQICARTGTRFEKKRAGSKTRFSSRTAAFARRVFPARNKLIREPGCVGKITTPATTWNSRFADSIPRLTGIFTGKVHKNSSDTPTSGSHNSLVRTPIRANFISLERGRRELSGDMLHDPF
uniref:Uncharacterized protein n=1 Tax=Fagus sylvatica TaxID=28930 RepID=A0A2N9F2Z2_FAGSY